MARHCLGFKEFVVRVEKDRIEPMAKDDPTLFQRLLPYAVVLGVADEWAERFEGLLTEPPTWYESPSWGQGNFYPRAMVTDLGQSMHAMGSTLTSRPDSSGGGGGFSGFSGGGGSSGGEEASEEVEEEAGRRSLRITNRRPVPDCAPPARP